MMTPPYTSRRGAPRGEAGSSRGFTLIEILVVMAISVLLLGLIFGPMISSFNLVHRGEQTAQAQETARRVMEQVTREVADAVSIAVYPGDILPVRMVQQGRGTVGGTAVPVRSLGYISALDHLGNGRMRSRNPLPMYGAMIDLLPADDTLGLHGGNLRQPLAPQVNEQGHPVIVRYFVGLRRPARDPQVTGSPRWLNPNERSDISGLGPDNTYLFFRVEFDPLDPLYANWVIADPERPSGLAVNPDFFYDQTKDAADPRGRTYAEVWREAAVSMVPVSDLDLVHFDYAANANLNDPAIRAASSVTFAPTRVDAEVASPSEALRGAPATYRVQHGQWAGVQNDGTILVGNIAQGGLPHISVVQNDNGMQTVYDSALKENQPKRVLSFDSRTGTIMFAQRAPELTFTTGSNPAVSRNNWLLDPVPALFPTLGKEPGPGGTPVPIAHIVPGTETVAVDGTLCRRSGLINIDGTVEGEVMVDTPDPASLHQVVPPTDYPRQLPAPGTYMLDLRNGQIIIGYPFPGPQNPLQPVPIPNGHKVTINFQYQTNHPNDIVRVDYLTRSLLTFNLGIRMYDRATGKPHLESLFNRIRIRNTGR